MRILVLIFVLFSLSGFAQDAKRVDSISNLSIPQIQVNLKQSIRLLRKNIEDAKQLGKTKAEAKSCALLALAYYFHGNYDQNMVYAIRGIKLFEKLGDYESVAKEYSELGYRIKATNIKDSELYLQKAMRIAEGGNYNKPLLSIYNQYGEVKSILGQEDSAMLYYYKGLKVKEFEKDSIGIPYSLVNIGYSYTKSKRFDLAKKYFDEAFQLRVKLKDQFGISDCYAYYGDLYFEMKSYPLAISNYEKSVEIAEKYSLTNLLRHDYRMLAQCYELVNDLSNSIKYHKKNQSLKDSILTIETNNKMAELQLQFDTSEKEKELLKQNELNEKRKKTIQFLILFLASVLILAILIFYIQRLRNKNQRRVFELQSSIEKIESENKLQEQRLGISRDLHDNIGAQLTFIISSISTLKSTYKVEDEKIKQRLDSIKGFAQETITELRDTIWVMKSNEITIEEMFSRIANFVEKARQSKETIDFHFKVDPLVGQITFTTGIGMNVFRIVQEAVNNALKYSQAKSIEIEVKKMSEFIEFTVSDNGNGFDKDSIIQGSGIYNMRKRAKEISAEIQIDAELAKGTEITLLVPV